MKLDLEQDLLECKKTGKRLEDVSFPPFPTVPLNGKVCFSILLGELMNERAACSGSIFFALSNIITQELPKRISTEEESEILSLLCKVHELEIEKVEMQSNALLKEHEVEKAQKNQSRLCPP